MKVYTLWHGGSGSYMPGSIPDDVEAFPSIAAAAREHERRQSGGDPFYPAVGSDSATWVYLYEPSEFEDNYPDRIITTGPRGGTRIERA